MKKIHEVEKYEYIIKLKLKSVLKPIVIIVEDKSIINMFFEKLNDSSSFMSIGQLAFNKYDFKYLIYKTKKVK